MCSYLISVWDCRYFWLSLIYIDLRARYRRSVLGLGWSLLGPLSMTALFCVVVRPLLMPDRPLGYCALFFLSGLACWNYVVHVTVQGCQALFRGEPYIRQYPAPMAVYPLRTALSYGVHLLIVLAAVLALSGCWHGGLDPLALLALIPGVLLLLLFGWSLAVLAGFANVYFQDTQHLCELGLQMLFYGTPILYAPELLEQKQLGWLLSVNPLVPLFRLLREPLLHATVPPPETYAVAAAVVAAFFLAAALTLARLQRRIIFYL